MSEAVQCSNCGRAIDGPAQKFCPACGQATPVHRIDWHFMAHELEHSVLHMDRGILYSLKELMLRPGRLMRDYLEGRRARQAKPFLLLMVTAAAVVFLGKVLLDGHVVDSVLQVSNLPATGANGDEQAAPAAVLQAQATVQHWMNRNFALITLLLIPLEALAFRLAFFGTGRLNYPEWLVVTALLTVQTFVFWGLSIPLQRWFPQAPAVAIGLAVCYMIYSLAQLFSDRSCWDSILRGLAGVGGYLIVTGFLSVIAGMLLAISLVR